MATAIIYAPITGSFTGIPAGYCACSPNPAPCGTHPATSGYTDAYDIGSVSAGSTIYVAANNAVLSIKVMPQVQNTVCYRSSEIGLPWDVYTEVRVYKYNNANEAGYLGSVLFGHLDQPQLTGTYNWPFGNLPIGKIAPSCACSCASGCKCGGTANPPNPAHKGYCATTALCGNTCPCVCCYGGPHIHLGRKNGSSYSYNCGNAATLGVTPLYQWTY
jgi:hypothetical protein